MSLLMLIAIVVALYYFLGKPKIVEGFSPGVVVQVHPSHHKKYYDPSKYGKDYEQHSSSTVGPLAPMHVLKAQNPEAVDPCFDEFDIPFSLSSLDSFMQIDKPSSGISTNMEF